MTKHCWFCGQILSKTGGHKSRSQTKDHLIPRGRGGKGLKNNTVDACKECNGAKGNLLLEEYRLVVAFRLGLIPKINYQFAGEMEADSDRIRESHNVED